MRPLLLCFIPAVIVLFVTPLTIADPLHGHPAIHTVKLLDDPQDPEEGGRADVPSLIALLDDSTATIDREAVQESLYVLSRDSRDFYGLKYYVEHARGEQLDSAWTYFYEVYTKDGYPGTYGAFRENYGNVFPNAGRIGADSVASADLLECFDKNGIKARMEAKVKPRLGAIADKDLAFSVLQFIIAKDVKAKNWASAQRKVQSYASCFGVENKKFNELLEILTVSDAEVKRGPMRGAIRAKKGEEYVPVISADNKRLYFCGQNRPDNLAGEDVFVSVIENGVCLPPRIIRDLSTAGNDAPLSISTDGNDMLMFKNGDLFMTSRTTKGWSEIEALPEPINSSSWDADAMMTSDGSAMIFASERPGGHDYLRRAVDIYVCVKEGDGWSEPINVGPTINTRYIDRSPFLHPDMKTLYFSSAGRGGLGGMDVFRSTRLNDSSWTEWSEPVNLGREINTAGDDWGYRISTDGEQAYYAARDNEGFNHIQTMTIPPHLRPNFVATVAGAITDRDGNPVDATIRWEDLSTQKKVGELRSNPSDGSYFIVLPLGKNYGYFVDKEGYFPLSNNLDLRKVKKPVSMQNNIVMPSIEQMRKEDLSVPVNNLFFEIDRSDLMRESIPELMRVAGVIKRNNVHVRISGHTDNTGGADHNQELSQARAEAVKTFLTRNGVPGAMIETVGFGDTRPVATNDTDEGKAKNRRVEMQFVD